MDGVDEARVEAFIRLVVGDALCGRVSIDDCVGALILFTKAVSSRDRRALRRWLQTVPPVAIGTRSLH